MSGPERSLASASPRPQRKKRRNSALDSPQKSQHVAGNGRMHQNPSITPGRRSKKVRFSDSSVPSKGNLLSTGITPHLRRSTIGTPRRERTVATNDTDVLDPLQFTPLRQVLDDRVKRRIARNGLSEEMNEYTADKRINTALHKTISERDAKIKKLEAELEATRAAAIPSSDPFSIPKASQERVDEIEVELQTLRQEFALEEPEPIVSWAHVPVGARGPSSEGGDTIQIYEDGDADQPPNATIDADSLAMGLELEAARQAKKSFLGSFRESSSFTEMNFADSPARRQHKAVGTSPRSPRAFHLDLAKQLKATTNRAEEAELALKALEAEVQTLGFGLQDSDGLQVIAAVAEHFRQARLDLERTLPGETVIGFENAKVLPELISKLGVLLAQLRSKETELKAAQDQQHNLKGNFEKALVAADKAASRVRDLESSIDSTAEEMLNIRIRSQNLEKDLVEKEKDIKTLTLALDKYRADVSRLENLITNLESNHVSALSNRDQATSELEAKVAAETRGRRAAENSAVARLAKISELESALSTAKSHAETVEEAMAKLQSHLEEFSHTHASAIGSLNTRINNLSTALASANAEVDKLKMTKSRLEERVRFQAEDAAQAYETIQNQFIKSLVKTNEVKKSQVRGAKVWLANYEIESDGLESDGIEPMTPTSIVRFSEFSEEIGYDDNSDVTSAGNDDLDSETPYQLPSNIEVGRGTTPKQRSKSAERRSSKQGGIMRSRRRYDSGIAMLESSDPDHDQGLNLDAHLKPAAVNFADDSGIMTPEMSSDADLEGDARMTVEVV